MVIGAMIPNKKNSILITRDPASSFSNKNEKKQMKAGFANTTTKNMYSTLGTSMLNRWIPATPTRAGRAQKRISAMQFPIQYALSEHPEIII